MKTRFENKQSKERRNRTASTSRPVSLMKRISQSFKRYWFVAVPAIMFNIGITLDHVVAKNNEDHYRVRIKEIALEALEASKSQDDAPLSDTLRAHWITTNEDGNLDGRISAIEPSQSSTVPIEKLDVALMKKGEKVHKAVTDNDGKFILKDVAPGVYTLLAAGRNGFLAYGVQVLPKREGIDILDDNTSIDSKKREHDYYVSHFNSPQDSVVDENFQIDAAAVPPEFKTLQRISQSYLSNTPAFSGASDQDDAKAVGKATNIRRGFEYPLDADNGFEGRIQPIATDDGQAAKLSDMNVFLIRNDFEEYRVSVEENGKFKIEDVDPGVYSLVAAGKDGFAALSVNLVPANAVETSAIEGNSKAHYVSNRVANPKAEPPLGIAIVTDPADIQAIKAELDRVVIDRQQNPIVPQGNQAPFAEADFANFPSDAPGGFPVGPGFPVTGGTAVPVSTGPVGGVARSGIAAGPRGRFLGVAGLALGITALATDDSIVDPPVESPIQPINID